MEWIFKKLKKTRELLDLTQEQAAEQAGIGQKDLSMLENGKREFIPNRYILWLANKGVDLNSIFVEDREVCLLTGDRPGEGVAPNSAPNVAPKTGDGELPVWVEDRLKNYDSRLKSLEGNLKDITKQLGKGK